MMCADLAPNGRWAPLCSPSWIFQVSSVLQAKQARVEGVETIAESKAERGILLRESPHRCAGEPHSGVSRSTVVRLIR